MTENLPIINLNSVARIKRILLIGHTGFIGSHLNQFFREHLPGIEIIGQSTPGFDLTKKEDVERVNDLLDLQTAVVMLAGIKRQLGDNLDTFSKNVQMAVNFCRVLQRRPVKRFIFFSSAAVYGEEIENTHITEQTCVHPTSLYGTSKYTAECLFEHVIRSQTQSSLVILRPPLIYGPKDSGGGYGPTGFIRAALDREAITIWGDGTERREFLYVSDVVEIVCRLIFSNYTGVLNIAAGRSYTYLNILEIISQILASKITTTSRGRSKNKVDHGFSNIRIKELVPDFSFTPLEEGIRRTIEATQISK